MTRHLDIQTTDSGFSVRQGAKELVKIKWNEIQEIIAYKRDLFTIDLVCFDIVAVSSGTVFSVHEEMSGFMELEHKLARVLPNFDLTWREKVLLPPFEESAASIFRRSPAMSTTN